MHNLLVLHTTFKELVNQTENVDPFECIARTTRFRRQLSVFFLYSAFVVRSFMAEPNQRNERRKKTNRIK